MDEDQVIVISDSDDSDFQNASERASMSKSGTVPRGSTMQVSDPDDLDEDQFADQAGSHFAETSYSRLLTERKKATINPLADCNNPALLKRYLPSPTSSSESDFDGQLKPLRKKLKATSKFKSKLTYGVTSDSEIDLESPVKRKRRRKVVCDSRTNTSSVSDSEISSPTKKKLTYLHDDVNLPVYKHTEQRYTTKEIVEVLLDKSISCSRIATSQPTSVQDNFVFIVDISKLDKPEDVRADDLGSWSCTGTRRSQCSVDEQGFVIDIISDGKSRRKDMFTLIKRYYRHSSAGDYKRTIAEIYDPSGDQLNRGFVQYTFIGKPHPVIQKPHGNCKSSKPFVRTTPSTLQKLKDSRKANKQPKQAVSEVTKQKGGIVNTKAIGDLPRNRKQVYNMKVKEDCEGNDALLTVMAMCKQSLGKDEDPFIRIVSSAPEPMCVMCTDLQLSDIERFCTSPEKFCPLTVDPTFNLGDFSVTVTSFQNLLLVHQRTNKHPVMIGPMLVHRRKMFSTYHFFASSLVSLKPHLIDLQSFGTDGEECLYSAFSTQFTSAQQLRCFLHFRDNCKAKLIEMKVQSDNILEIIQDILGSFLRGKPGLVNAQTADDLTYQFHQLESRWEQIAPGFSDWFSKHKLHIVESTMLSSVRQSAGLGNPPEPFYTNQIESINRVIKHKTGYKTSEWPSFCKMAKELVDEQQSEIEKAIIGVGEYKFCAEFKHLEISLGRWSSMTKVQRQNHVKHINRLSLQDASTPPNQRLRNEVVDSSKVYRICGQSFNANTCPLSDDILRCMFNKAEKLVRGENSICSSPGSLTAKLVESKSGSRPHFVTVKANHKYCCDSDCPMWKCAKLCAHTIASAYVDGKLQVFLNQTVSTPNHHELAKSDTTKNPGKKPASRKASTKSSTNAIQALQSEIAPLKTPPMHLMSPQSHITCISSGMGTQVSDSGHYSMSNVLTYPPSHRLEPHSSHIARGTAQPLVTSTCLTVTSSATSGGTLSQVNPVSTAHLNPSHGPVVPAITSLSGASVLSSTIVSLLSQALSGVSSAQATSSMQQSSTIDSNYLFWITVVCGNISRCQGCTDKILRDPNGKPLPPPDDIVLQHKEQVLFNNPNTGLFQLSKDHRNVYYHARKSCVSKKYPTFQASVHCRISEQTLQALNQTHLDYLAKEFGIKFSPRSG